MKVPEWEPELTAREGKVRPGRESERPKHAWKPGKPAEERGLGLIEIWEAACKARRLAIGL